MARNTARKAPPQPAPEQVTVGGSPGAPNVGRAPTTGQVSTLRADPTRDYLAGRTGGSAWWLNMAQALPDHIDDLTEHAGDDTYERMYRDPQVAASANVFKAAVVETGPAFTTAIDDEDDPDYAKAQFIADWCTAIVKDLKTPIDDVVWNMMDAFHLGNKVAELVYQYSDQYWALPAPKPKPKYGPNGEQLPATPVPVRLPQGGGPQLVLKAIKVKPRQSVGFLVDAFNNILGILGHIPGAYYPIQHGMVYTSIDQIPNLLPASHFAILTFRPHDGDPRGTSMFTPAYGAWYLKQQLWAEYGKFLSQMAGGMLVGKPDPNALPESIQDAAGQMIGTTTPEEALLQTLLKAQNGAVLVVQPGADVQVHYPTADGAAFLEAFMLLNLEMTKGILHVTLATEEGRHQSRSAAEVHVDVLQLLIRVAKQSVERLIQDILRRMIVYNYGDDASKFVPIVSLGETDSADQSKLWTAVAALKSASYFTADQMPQLDSLIGLPVRLPTDPADLAAQQTQQAGATPPGAIPGAPSQPAARGSPSVANDGMHPEE